MPQSITKKIGRNHCDKDEDAWVNRERWVRRDEFLRIIEHVAELCANLGDGGSIEAAYRGG